MRTVTSVVLVVVREEIQMEYQLSAKTTQATFGIDLADLEMVRKYRKRIKTPTKP